MSKIKSWIMIHRPIICALVGFGVSIGYLFVTIKVGKEIKLSELTIGIILSMFIGGGCNILNDALDVEIDKIDKPFRAIPKGDISIRQAYVVSGTYLILSPIIGLFIDIKFGCVLAFTSLFTTHYSIKGKYTPFVGTLEQPLGAALIPIAGSSIVGDVTTLFPLFVFIFLFELSHSILLHDEDREVDINKGKTIVHVIGSENTSLLVIFVYALSIIWAVTPYFGGGYSILYRVSSQYLSLFLMLISIFVIISGHEPKILRIWNRHVGRVLMLIYQVCLFVEASLIRI